MNRTTRTIAALLIAGVAVAHESPDHVISRLDTEIALHGSTPRKLALRAAEQAALGRHAEAAASYRHALESDPTSLTARLGLARALLAAGDHGAALSEARLGPGQASGIDLAAPFHAVAASAHEALGEFDEAVVAWEQATRAANAEVDWLLAHATALSRVGDIEAACESLATARRQNASVVLVRASVETLLEAGRPVEALELIESTIGAAENQPTWGLLRARALLATGERSEALRVLHAAKRRIDQRLLRSGDNPILQRQSEVAGELLAAAQPSPGGTP